MSRRIRVTLLLTPIVVVALVAGLLQTLAGHSFFRDSEAFGAIAFVAFGAVGALILGRDVDHLMGRVLYLAGAGAVLTWAADNYARYSVEEELHLPGELFAAWFQNWAWFFPIGVIFTFGLLLFPDGDPPSPRWRPIAWLAGISLTVLTIAFALHDEPLDGFPNLHNPTGLIPDGVPLAAVAFGGVVISALASVGAVAWRFWRSSGIVRQQLKWVAFAALLMAAANLGLPPLGARLSEAATDLVFGLSTLLLPIACGIAILRYRLYDIDLVINRTLVYGSLTALLALAYLGSVFVLQELLTPLTRESDLAVAGSTLAVAALFRPLRSRVQAFIDRRFYRRKYDASETLAAFSSHLRDQVALESLSHELVGVVAATMQPAHASLWLRPAAGEGNGS